MPSANSALQLSGSVPSSRGQRLSKTDRNLPFVDLAQLGDDQPVRHWTPPAPRALSPARPGPVGERDDPKRTETQTDAATCAASIPKLTSKGPSDTDDVIPGPQRAAVLETA